MNRFYLSLSRILFGVVFCGSFVAASTKLSTKAQNPVDWQTTAVGLSAVQNSAKRTAGLAFTIRTDSWPFLSLQGGVKAANGKLTGPIGIELGLVKIPGNQSTPSIVESLDWAHNELTFTAGLTQVKLWASRLTPGLLIQANTSALQLFGGNLSGNLFDGTQVTPRPLGHSWPKHIAYSSGSNVQVRSLSQSSVPLPALDQNWLLVWYGDNSHFVDTQAPLSYSYSEQFHNSLPQSYAYQADAPMLIIFQNSPASIRQAVDGGVEVVFTGEAGNLILLPILGRLHPLNVDTEAWSNGLPADILQKAQWWASHLCQFPSTVTESYSYDPDSDRAIINETFNFIQVCSGGTVFAPLPPALALSRAVLKISTSGTETDTGLNTEFGPAIGFEGVGSYTWQVTGLKKYTDPKRIITNTGKIPVQLEQDLNTAVEKILQSGHFAPWLFTDSIPFLDYRGDIYWLNQADTLVHLIEAAAALPDGDLKSRLIAYIQEERSAYPPEDVFNLPLDSGAIRGSYSVSGTDIYNRWRQLRPELFLNDVPLYNYYALARYYELTQEGLTDTTWQKANQTLDWGMREQDWATFYWFKDFEDRRVTVVNANRHFSGLVGYIKLAKLSEDSGAEALGRALLAKAAVMRLSLALYPEYLYTSGLVQLPSQPDWQVRQTTGHWLGYIFNYSWGGAADDPQQVVLMNQFGILLADSSGFMEPGTGFRDWEIGTNSPFLVAFRDLSPELGRFLAHFAQAEARKYIVKIEAITPHWYTAFAEGTLGAEHNLSHPVDSFQIFLAKAWIMRENPRNLLKYIDIPWLEAGDLFYLQKLSETVKIYCGIAWEDAPPGDISPLNINLYFPLIRN